MDDIKLLISGIRYNPLRNSESRFEFAKSIQSATNYFSVSEILNFLQEMQGLNLKNKADQQIFIDFLKAWMRLGE